ncbi:MAG: hypothetical protein K2Y32_06840 [Candidatus Obscuribacterales bacterium]|nr:hypothetical protein [Candidatus Obscuribacterales bacterium]
MKYILLLAFISFLVRKTLFCVNQTQVAFVERFGKYRRTAQSGLNFVIPIIERAVGPLSTKTRHRRLNLCGSGKDKKTVRFELSVWYKPLSGAEHLAYYLLPYPEFELQQFLQQSLHKSIDGLTLKEMQEQKEALVQHLRQDASAQLTEYGWTISRILADPIKEIQPSLVQSTVPDK